jgi:hypothetical protein
MWLVGEDCEDVFFPHHQVFFAFHLDFGAGILAEQDPVAFLQLKGHAVTGVAHFAGADGDDFAFNGLLFGGIGNEDAAFGDLTSSIRLTRTRSFKV